MTRADHAAALADVRDAARQAAGGAAMRPGRAT